MGEKNKGSEFLLGLDEAGLMKKYENAVALNERGFNVTGAKKDVIEKVSQKTGWKLYRSGDQIFLKNPEK